MAKTQSEVLYFYGSNCPVCTTMTPFIDEAGEKFEGRVAFRKVNVSQSQRLAQEYRVMAVPTTVSLSNGVYTLAYRIIRDRHLAEDVVQDTFFKVIRSLAGYRGDGPIAAWTYRIGYREAIAVTRRRREEPPDPSVIAAEIERPTGTVGEQVLAGELATRLDEAIGSLSEPVRGAFVLRDVEGLSTGEVASALERSEAAVKMRLARSREAIRRQLKEYLR